MTNVTDDDARQVAAPEHRHAEELAFLAAYDEGPRPPGWALTPSAVVTFVLGSDGPLSLPRGRKAPAGGAGRSVPSRLEISAKYVGDRGLVERCVVTLAGTRGLLLVGEPGTAKSMLSELLSASICGTSGLVVQGSAGTTENQLRYGWNYAMLIAQGPSEQALVPSPVMAAMQRGALARVEEVTRCLPEVQDALISLLSERRIAVPELGDHAVHARPGFGLIATANLRDRGVSEMSAALKRRFNFEQVDPIADLDAEIALVTRQTRQALEDAGTAAPVDDVVVELLVTAFRDLRSGISAEGWAVERPSTAMSTAEAVAISTSVALASAYFPNRADGLRQLPRHLLGAVRKDDATDAQRLLGYFDGVVRRRAESGTPTWNTLWELRSQLEE